MTGNTEATTTGQLAADGAVADVDEMVIDGKDTPGVLRPLLVKRGDGGAIKSCDVAASESMPFDSDFSTCGNLDPRDYHVLAALAHDTGASGNTPCIGPTSLVGPDGWCPPGGGDDTSADSLPFTGGSAGDPATWVPVVSMTGKDHQGAATQAAPFGASINANCDFSSLSNERPGEMLRKPPASHASLSFSTSCSSNTLSRQLALKTKRHSRGDHCASSGPSGKRAATGSAEEYCEPADLPIEYAPAFIGTPAGTGAAGTMYDVPISQSDKGGGGTSQ